MQLCLPPTLLLKILLEGSRPLAVSSPLLHYTLASSQQGQPVATPLTEGRVLSLTDESQGIAVLLVRMQLLPREVGELQRESVHEKLTATSMELTLDADEAEVCLVVPTRTLLPELGSF